MGLDCSHEAYHGSYSSFDHFRRAVATAAGCTWPTGIGENEWHWGEGMSKETNPGLWEFLSHSDCDGEISPEMCVKVADELEKLLPVLAGMESAHFASRNGWGYKQVAQNFIDGCRAAAQEGKPLIFA